MLGFHVTTHWRILASLCGLSLVISVLTCLDRELVWGRLLRRSSTASLPGICVIIAAKVPLRALRLWSDPNDTPKDAGETHLLMGAHCGSRACSGPCVLFLHLSGTERDLQPHREPLFVAAVSCLGCCFGDSGCGEVRSHDVGFLFRQAAAC